MNKPQKIEERNKTKKIIEMLDMSNLRLLTHQK
jgi:hypothetical protein